MMKKMIVCDMDKTLLNDKQQLGKLTRETLKTITDRGIVFAAASGRSRPNLEDFFQGIPFVSISDNGSTLYDVDGSLIWYEDCTYEQLKGIWQLIMDTDFLHPVFCGLKKNYVLESETEAAREVAWHYFNGFNGRVGLVSSIEDVFDRDRLVKISLHTSLDGSEEQKGLRLLKDYMDQFMIRLSGEGWIDVISKKASKGIAYERLCAHLGLEPEETMVFGDYLNDLDMLVLCPDSWCMLNGHPEVKKQCRHVTRYTNDQDGVAREIIRTLGLDG